jgi:hypothetical protein
MFVLIAAALALASLAAVAFSRQFYDPADPSYARFGFAAPPVPVRARRENFPS